MSFLRKPKHSQSANSIPLQRSPDNDVTFDDRLQQVVDTNSLFGEDMYLPTITHRGPKILRFYEDQGTPHNTDYMCRSGNVINLYRLKSLEHHGVKKPGILHYTIVEDPDSNPTVSEQFYPRSEYSDMTLIIPEGQYVKEFSEDYGLRNGKNKSEVDWLKQTHQLTPKQILEMSLANFVITIVGAYSSNPSSFIVDGNNTQND